MRAVLRRQSGHYRQLARSFKAVLLSRVAQTVPGAALLSEGLRVNIDRPAHFARLAVGLKPLH